VDFKTIIGTVAPWIGTALGGPLGGMAVDTIAKVFGLSDKSEASIKAALSGATPEQMLALKEADNDFKIQMTKLGFDNLQALEKTAADDRNSARQREMAVKDYTPRILAGLIVALYGGVQIFLLTNVVNEDMREIVMRSLGTLDASLGLVLSYYFGSSAGSKLKDETIANTTAATK
jgi:hypothetical protein